MRAGILQHQNIVGLDVERGIVDARGEIGERGEHHRPALVLEQLGVGRRALEDGALRREIAEQRDQPALRLQRLAALGDDRAVDPASPSSCSSRSPSVSPVTVMAIEMQQLLQFAQQRAHAAGGEEILHVAVADRLEVHQHRRRVGQFVELLAATLARRRGRRSRSDG